MSVSGVGSSSSSSSGVSAGQSGLGLGTDDFLKLLVAQLKNQDPMNPASGTEFLSQTAQFSSVEKLTQLTQQYTDLITSQRVVEATGFLGRIVGFTDAQGNAVSGKVDSVSLASGGPVLHVGSVSLPLASVGAVLG